MMMKHGPLRKPLVCALLLVGAACAPAASPSRTASGPEGMVTTGVARVDITPTEPIRLTGYADRRTPTDSIGERLSATALAFGADGEDPAVLVAVELVGIPLQMTEELARRLEKAGVDREQLVVTATHTHTGPSLAGVLPGMFTEIPAEQEAVIRRYSERLVLKLEEVALAALADRRPARLAWGQGTTDFAVNRRMLKDGRWSGFGVNPEGPVDHDLPLLTVREPDGRLRAVLLGYASHATTLTGRENFIHGDWPGAAKEMIEERHPGALALITIGAGADANPEPRGSGVADVVRNATKVAAEVDRLLAAPLRPLGDAPKGRLRMIRLPFEPLPERSELERRATLDGADGLLARAALQRMGRGETLPSVVTYPVQTWTFADELAMVFLGGEVVVDYSHRLKAELDRSRLWVTAYANDVSFYVASSRTMREGGYEVDRSMVYYGQPSRLAPTTEEAIVRAVHDLLPGEFSRSRAR